MTAFELGAAEPVAGIDYRSIESAYDARGLDQLSDHDLATAVAAVLANPRDAEFDSFVLHAPLELMARLRLLAMVAPSERRVARMRMVSIASHYETFGEPLRHRDAAGMEPRSTTELVADLFACIDAGDLDGTDRHAMALRRHPVDAAELTRLFIPRVLRRTAAAAHTPIFLSLAMSTSLSPSTIVAMLRPMSRELAREPNFRLSWLDDHTPAAVDTDAQALDAALVDAPHLGINGTTFVHPTMKQVDVTGVARQQLGPVLARSTAAARRTLIRRAVRSMLDNDVEHAKYGWTHTLTIPQACLHAGSVGDADDAFAVAATHVLGFRCALRDLWPANVDANGPTEPNPENRRKRWDAFLSSAATAHDAHIAKYALAVHDAASLDPEFADDCLEAGERLLAVWNTTGDPTDPLTT